MNKPLIERLQKTTSEVRSVASAREEPASSVEDEIAKIVGKVVLETKIAACDGRYFALLPVRLPKEGFPMETAEMLEAELKKNFPRAEVQYFDEEYGDATDKVVFYGYAEVIVSWHPGYPVEAPNVPADEIKAT